MMVCRMTLVHKMWSRVVAWMLLVALLCSVTGWVTTVSSAVQSGAALNLCADQWFLLEQLIADKAITVAHERRLADIEQEKIYAQLQAIQAAEAHVRRTRDQIRDNCRARPWSSETRRLRQGPRGIAR